MSQVVAVDPQGSNDVGRGAIADLMHGVHRGAFAPRPGGQGPVAGEVRTLAGDTLQAGITVCRKASAPLCCRRLQEKTQD